MLRDMSFQMDMMTTSTDDTYCKPDFQGLPGRKMPRPSPVSQPRARTHAHLSPSRRPSACVPESEVAVRHDSAILRKASSKQRKEAFFAVHLLSFLGLVHVIKATASSPPVDSNISNLILRRGLCSRRPTCLRHAKVRHCAYSSGYVQAAQQDWMGRRLVPGGRLAGSTSPVWPASSNSTAATSVCCPGSSLRPNQMRYSADDTDNSSPQWLANLARTVSARCSSPRLRLLGGVR